MRIAVTGGSGFIGSRLVDALTQGGHVVDVLDVKSSGHAAADGSAVDITRLDEVKERLRGVELVYHLAGPVLEAFRKNPYNSHFLQDVGTLNTLEAARLNNVSKVILASSFYVYDGVDERMVVNEETQLDITRMELFGASKLMAERLVKAYAAKHRLAFVILRFGSAYGWGDCSNVIKSFIEMGIQGQPIEVWGAGTRRNQYTQVDDIVSGCVAAIGETNETYNLISPEETTTGDLARRVGNEFGFDVVFNEAQREGSSMAFMCSRKATKRLGWSPTAIAEGIRRMKQECSRAAQPSDRPRRLEAVARPTDATRR